MDTILLAKSEDGGQTSTRRWLLSNLSCACNFEESAVANPLGEITSEGSSRFATGSLPPEMFVRLTPPDLRMYRRYWDYVQSKLKVKCDEEAVEPKVDARTGVTYGVKCHFSPLTESNINSSVPKLPYELKQPSLGQDLWAFGLVLFHLCAGRPLFPVNNRSGHLLSYHEIINWTLEDAKDRIYEHVKDNTAQDLLLRLLAPAELRNEESFEAILSHPFFSDRSGSSTFGAEKRKIEASSHKRRLQSKLMEVSENVLLEERTVKINCWDFDVLERISMSPTEMVKRMIPDQQWRHVTLPFPCALIFLPSAAASSCGDEAFALEYLKFSKACYFAAVMKKAVESFGKNPTSRPQWSSCTNVLEELGLAASDFHDVQTSLSELSAKHVELFRSDPYVVALKVVQQTIKTLFSCFDQSDAFFYLIDEYRCTPVESETYPIVVSDEDRKADLLQNGLLLMHLSSLYARGVSKDVSGLAKLFAATEGDSASAPDSWRQASQGLPHKLDDRHFVDEISVLQDVLTEMSSTRHRIAADDLNFVQEFLYDTDPKRTFGNMRRVSACSDMCLWTSVEGTQEIEELSRTVTFRDVLEKLRED